MNAYPKEGDVIAVWFSSGAASVVCFVRKNHDQKNLALDCS